MPGGEATPVDVGDVCINVDTAWFDEHQLAPPADLDALADPTYQDLLVVENPASSSPGLAFLLATIVTYGDDGWVDYWKRLRTNGVQVVDTWTDAYYGAFSGGGDGTKPIVVSYASSPPAEVVFADPPIDKATTASVDSTCFRQVEFAGVLRGTQHTAEARQLIDFMVSTPFQSALPLNLFVYPANSTVALPDVFTANATVPADPATMEPATIGANRREWLDTWTDACCAERCRAGGEPAASAGRRRPRRRPGRVPRRLLRVAVRRAAGERAAPERHRRHARSVVDVAGGVVHALAGAGQHGGDDRHRARPRLRHRPVRVRRAARCSTPCSPRCSCCRRW